MRQAYIYICLMFTFCGCEWCIYTPVLYLGPYHTKKRSLAALQGKSHILLYHDKPHLLVCSSILHSGKLSWEKTYTDWWKKDYRGDNFCGLLAGTTKRHHTPTFYGESFCK